MTSLADIYRFVNWTDKQTREPPNKDLIETISLEEVGVDSFEQKRRLEFEPQEFHLAVRILGRMKQTIRRSRRTLWLWDAPDGTKRLAVTKEKMPKEE